MEPPSVVRPGDTVIWDVNGEKQALVTVDGRSRVKLGKVFCSAAPLVGCPYGAMFALSSDSKSLERTEYVPLSDWDLPDGPNFNTRSNAELVDGGTEHQGLSTAEIELMKAEGKSGADIVAALTANSATFAGKTEFSQEKYRKKKARKYIQVATVRRPTAAAVCEAYFANSPAKTAYLRVDALAMLISLANVGAHARVLVVEACGGMITAAALERQGADSAGCVVSAWPGGAGAKRPSLDMWRHFNFPPAQRAALRFAPLQQLLQEQRQEAGGAAEVAAGGPEQQEQRQQQEQQVGGAADATAGGQEQRQQRQQQEAAAEQQPEAAATVGEAAASAELMDVQDGASAPAGQQQQQQQEQGKQQEQGQQEAQQPAAGASAAAAAGAAAATASPRQQQQGPFNCCILASNSVSPLALVRHVLPLLAPSASLAVFSPWPHPLAEAMDALRGQGQVAGLALQETWWREMQVLPLRTHPTMNMNHGGGFILSATVLASNQQQQQEQQQ